MIRKLLLLAILTASLSFAESVYELRTYTAPEGKLDALLARFRDHTIRIFKKHSMESVGYWVPQDPEKSKNTLIYILKHPSREAGEKNWMDFQKHRKAPLPRRDRTPSLKDKTAHPYSC